MKRCSLKEFEHQMGSRKTSILVIGVNGQNEEKAKKETAIWYYPLQVDREKREHDKMFLTVNLEGIFVWQKRGKRFKRIQKN
jgi:hypothetical protein